jgi:hypothetical protein
MGLFDKIFNKKNINDNKEVIILSEEKDDIQEQIKKAMELEKIKTQKMYDNLTDDEKRFIEFFIKEAIPYSKGNEIIYNFRSGNINFEIKGMQIGRISLNNKKCEMQILTEDDVEWIRPITYEDAIKNVDKWIKYLKYLMQDK